MFITVRGRNVRILRNSVGKSLITQIRVDERLLIKYLIVLNCKVSITPYKNTPRQNCRSEKLKEICSNWYIFVSPVWSALLIRE